MGPPPEPFVLITLAIIALSMFMLAGVLGVVVYGAYLVGQILNEVFGDG